MYIFIYIYVFCFNIYLLRDLKNLNNSILIIFLMFTHSKNEILVIYF